MQIFAVSPFLKKLLAGFGEVMTFAHASLVHCFVYVCLFCIRKIIPSSQNETKHDI
jgi:hypothetical protein